LDFTRYIHVEKVVYKIINCTISIL